MKKIVRILIAPIIFIALFAYAEKIKIGFIGDSITVQNGVADSYPGQLATFLGDGYEVGNFGVSGRTMLKNGDYPIWNEPQFTQALAFQPDILFIFLGTNDSKPYNWDEHKDEYLVDYAAMIDTFKHSEHPPQEVWAILPPPAFAVKWDIRDSIITTDIIPMINQLVADSNLKSIDFNTPFIDKPALFPDDIHPNIQGSEEMAMILYEALTGKTFQSFADVNVCKNKAVTDGAGTNLEVLTDGDPQTGWTVDGMPASVYIDLGETETVDAFVVQFPDSRYAGIQYTIEGAENPGVWTPLVDQSLRDDALSVASTDTIVPTAVRYLRLTITGAVNPDSALVIGEFQAYQFHGAHHAPVVTPWVESVSSRFVSYQMVLTPITDGDELFKLYRNLDTDDPYSAATGFKDTSYTQYKVSVRPGQTFHYFSRAYLDGAFVVSDTVTISEPLTAVRPDGLSEQPADLFLDQNYPNPFNPETLIQFAISEKGNVNLSIHDIRGRLVRSLVSENRQAGSYSVLWDGRNDLGHTAASGIYISRLIFNDQNGQKQVVSRKMSMVR